MSIHHKLAEARASLRAAKDEFNVVKAESEQQYIAQSGSIGKNAEERDRTLIVALAANPGYIGALGNLRGYEVLVEQLEADLEKQKDQRREREWLIRAALVDALNARNMAHEDTTGDAPFDAAADDEIFDDEIPF